MNNMTAKDIKIWIWVQNNRIHKAISNKESKLVLKDLMSFFRGVFLKKASLSFQARQGVENQSSVINSSPKVLKKGKNASI